MIILKVTKNQGFTLSLKDTFFEKPQGRRGQIDPPSRFRVNIKIKYTTWNKICVIDVSVYIYVFFVPFDTISPIISFYFQWSNRNNKELGPTSLKPLATECSVLSNHGTIIQAEIRCKKILFLK